MGASTLIMAKAFPNSKFHGCIRAPLRQPIGMRASRESKNVHFRIATAKDFPCHEYEFATIFDALHDMGDPVGAASHIRRSLRSDGVLMIAEPMAGDSL